jgi:hypothetical protein
MVVRRRVSFAAGAPRRRQHGSFGALHRLLRITVYRLFNLQLQMLLNQLSTMLWG